MAFCKLRPLALKLVLLCLPQCLLGWSIATHLDPRFWFVFIVYSCSSFYSQPFGVILYLVFCSYIDFLESLWTIKNTFSDYKSKCAFCETNGNCRKCKEEKKTSTSNPPLQGQLLLHFNCTSIVQLLCTLFTCFSLLCKTFLIQYFYFICSLFKKTLLFRTWIASSTCFQSHQWQ